MKIDKRFGDTEHFDYDTWGSRISQIKCMVVGDIMLDQFLYGSVDRVSPEAPIPIVHIKKKLSSLGGAGNVAAGIRRFGAETLLCGILGNDENGARVINMADSAGIQFVGVTDNEYTTIVKSRVVGENQQIVRFDEETYHSIRGHIFDNLISKINWQNISIIVLSDYNKGFCSPEYCQRIIQKAKALSIPIIVDPKSQNWDRYRGADIITPNLKEFSQAAGKNELLDTELISEARKLLAKYHIDSILVTMSERGMLLINSNEHYRLMSRAREVADVTGAGDMVVSTLAVFLAAGMKMNEAVGFANIAAGLAVERIGTSTVPLPELIDAAHTDVRRSGSEWKIMCLGDLITRLSSWREQGKRIVFTNGCFDLVHPGHVEYLEQANLLGDTLIVGLNSDQSVKCLKGDRRPINNQKFRARILASLQSVDVVVIFDEPTPERIIEAIRPDILVKGGDYEIDDVLGKEYAEQTIIIPYVKGFSTTGVINRCKDAM